MIVSCISTLIKCHWAKGWKHWAAPQLLLCIRSLTSIRQNSSVGDTFWFSSFKRRRRRRRKDSIRAARKQVKCCVEVEGTERMQVVLVVDSPLEIEMTQLVWLAAHSWPPADAVNTGCTAVPLSQMSSSLTHLLLIPLNLSQMPHAPLLLLSHQRCPSPFCFFAPAISFPWVPPVTLMSLSITVYRSCSQSRAELCRSAVPWVWSSWYRYVCCNRRHMDGWLRPQRLIHELLSDRRGGGGGSCANEFTPKRGTFIHTHKEEVTSWIKKLLLPRQQ